MQKSDVNLDLFWFYSLAIRSLTYYMKASRTHKRTFATERTYRMLPWTDVEIRMVPSPLTHSNSVSNELLATIAKFRRTGLLMNVNEEAARIFGLCPQSHIGLSQLQDALMRRGATALISMHVGDGAPLAVAAKVLPMKLHKARHRSVAVSRWGGAGGSWIPIPKRLNGLHVIGIDRKGPDDGAQFPQS
jgi:hypothetical protein